MPVTPEYEWSQTDEEVVIDVKIKGITKQRMDVFATDAMVKVVAHPYVLILDLLEDVDADASTAYTQSGHVTFRMKKRKRRTWEQIAHGGSKAEREVRRNKSIEAAHNAAEAQRKSHVERLKASKTAATNRQIEIDRKKRREIEAAKAAELQREREKLQRWQDGDAAGDESDCEELPELKEPAAADSASADSDHAEYYGKGYRGPVSQNTQKPAKSRKHKKQSKKKCSKQEPEPKPQPAPLTTAEKLRTVIEEIDSDSESSSESEESEESDAQQTEATTEALHEAALYEGPAVNSQPVKLLPPPRPGMEAVEVDFTKLEFPHLPAREKREEEIKLYKKTQEDAMRTANSVDVSDRQPIFLKDKGDGLYAQGNFHAAINAYNIAIERDEEDSQLSLLCRLNRAACHSRVKAYGSCITDCDHVIELLQKAEAAVLEGRHPDPDQWKRLLVKALARRSAAQAHIGEVENALEGSSRALTLDANNVELQSMRKELEASAAPADWEGLKQRALARYSSKQYAAAAEVYEVLAKRPGAPLVDTVSALTNQGMCLLCNQQYRAALAKCEAALMLATGFQKLPTHAWAASWLQEQLKSRSGDDAVSKDAQNLENKENGAQAVPSEPQTDSTGDNHQKIDEEKEKNVQGPKTGSLKLLYLVPKTLGRMASCSAHQKEYESAYRLYLEASEASRTLGMEAEAHAFNGDATSMQELMKQEKDCELANSAQNCRKESVLDCEAAVAGG